MPAAVTGGNRCDERHNVRINGSFHIPMISPDSEGIESHLSVRWRQLRGVLNGRGFIQRRRICEDGRSISKARLTSA